MAFNRDRNSRPRFGNRGNRGPVEMHKAICDNCGKECEVPFRPTSGKPIYCSSCFENNRGSDSRNSGGRNFDRPRFEEKQMFDAKCDECGNNCQVPFRPSGDKPVYCSNCFGEKKNNGPRNAEQPSQPQNTQQFDQLNTKLDKILNILQPIATEAENLDKPAEAELEAEVEEKPKKIKKSPARK